MSEQNEARRQRRSETTTYLVQVKAGQSISWSDVGQIEVPSGTRRRTVFEKAVAEVDLSMEPATEGLMRCIPVEDAVAFPVSYEQPPAQLKVTF